MWEYPMWDVPRLGGGMVIALIATVHVVVAHFSVGAGLILAIGESTASKRNDQILLAFLKKFSIYLLLIGFVFGAITGVGIWFAISLASTRATSALIHTFVWFWAIEWVFFLIEITAGYAYYTTWDKVSRKTHITLAWIYAAAAWLSLFIISGILSFMLSPGEWTVTRNVWHGFLNPTFLPTVGLRTISSLSIAALFAILIVNLPSRWTREERTHLINYLARYLAPLVLMLPFALWYFLEVPTLAQHMITGGAIAMMLFFLFGIVASTLVGFYAYIGLIRHKRYVNLETSIMLLAIAVIATASMEFVREGVRKPFIIYDYLYSNGLTIPEMERVNLQGVVNSAPWERFDMEHHEAVENPVGHLMYKVQCSQCHVREGFNDMTPLIRHWGRDLLIYNLERIHELKVFMPPLVGTAEERAALADYLWSFNETYRQKFSGKVVLENEPSDPRS